MKLTRSYGWVPGGLPISLCSQEAQLHHQRWGALLGFPWEQVLLDRGLMLWLGLLFTQRLRCW